MSKCTRRKTKLQRLNKRLSLKNVNNAIKFTRRSQTRSKERKRRKKSNSKGDMNSSSRLGSSRRFQLSVLRVLILQKLEATVFSKKCPLPSSENVLSS